MKSILFTSSSSDSTASSYNSQISNNLSLLAESFNDEESRSEKLEEDGSAEKFGNDGLKEKIFVDNNLLDHSNIIKKQVIKNNKSSSKNNDKLKKSDKNVYLDIECEQRWQKATSDVNSDYFSLHLENHPLIDPNNVKIINESDNFSSRGKVIPTQTTSSPTTSATKLINLRKKNGTTLIFQRKNCSQQAVVDCIEYQELEIESLKKRQSLHLPYKSAQISNHAKSDKSRLYSWHDPYNFSPQSNSIEEEFENSSLTHFESKRNNLAETIIASSLLSVNNTANDDNVPDNNIIMKTSVDNSIAATTGATSKRWHNIEQFLKSLVGKRSSSQVPNASTNAVVASSVIQKVNKSPSVYDLLQQKPSGGSTVSLNKDQLINKSTASLNSTSLALVHQKLWSVVPLLSRKDGSSGGGASCSNLLLSSDGNSSPHGKMRKCETVLALTDEKQQHKLQASTSACSRTHSKSINNLLDPLPMRPLNRLRNSQSCYVNCDSNPETCQAQTCSRCSSLLSLAAIGGSSYSLKNGAFVLKNGKHLKRHTNKNSSLLDDVTTEDSSNRNLIENDFNSIELCDSSNAIHSSCKESQMGASVKFSCKLCLGEYFNEDKLTTISSCACTFCTECMRTYIEFEISEGAYELSCPDALCSSQGVISLAEISQLASASLVAKHHRYRLNREVELDRNRLWCPNRNCETICSIPTSDKLSPSTSSQSAIQQPSSSTANLILPRSILCPTCSLEFCSGCKKAWHPQITCDENSKRLGSRNNSLMFFDNDLIKMCPMCSVPIEKDEGCAQMMCKRCKHVFCWYCLASLDDDFLLRHYDKGPCKNKLGHSRASVVWHRAQVIGIFAGFGILLLVASPLLLLAAPCIVCCKCKIEESTTAAKLDEPEHHSDHQV